MDCTRIRLRIVWGADCPLLKLPISKPWIGHLICFDMSSEKA